MHLKVSPAMSGAAERAIRQLRDYLTEQSIPALADHVAERVVQGVEEAIIERNGRMHSTERQQEIAKLNHEMFLVLRLTLRSSCRQA